MLTKCKKCGHKSNGKSTACPSCGFEKREIDNRRVGIALVLFIFLCIFLFTRPESEQPEPMEAPAAQENVNPAVTSSVNQEQPKQEALYQELKQELEQDKTKNSSSTDTPQKMVMRMLEYALVDGGLSHESEIQQTKLQIESLPKPAKGNKKAARVFNADGLASSKNYDFNNAVKMFEEANKLDKSDIEIASNLGFSYLKQGDLDLAQHAIIIALSMSPDRASAWADLGAVFGLKGDVSKAVACFSNAYRFSKDRLKTHQFMKKLNETEDVATVKQARTETINWAEKAYLNIPENTESKERVTPEDISEPLNYNTKAIADDCPERIMTYAAGVAARATCPFSNADLVAIHDYDENTARKCPDIVNIGKYAQMVQTMQSLAIEQGGYMRFCKGVEDIYYKAALADK